ALDLAAAALALLARRLRHLAGTAANVAHDAAHDLAERRAADRLKRTRPLAARARLDRRARLGGVAVAARAQLDRLEAELDGRPRQRLGERDRLGDPDVATLARPG